jgi:hypothetical protein
MEKGKGKHLTILHLYTGYKITDKSIEDMTLLQYNAVFIIAEQIQRFKTRNKPMVVI